MYVTMRNVESKTIDRSLREVAIKFDVSQENTNSIIDSLNTGRLVQDGFLTC